jgi:hypothetical protein
MDFLQNKDAMNAELDRFVLLLNDLLPRYSILLKKSNLNNDELKNLGDIEHFLIEVNSKITEIKNMLDEDLFGHSIDLYYKIKAKALKGDPDAKLRLERMRDTFSESLQGETIMLWN